MVRKFGRDRALVVSPSSVVILLPAESPEVAELAGVVISDW